MPGNMPPPGQRIPLGSVPQPRPGPGWQNMRPPAGNLPPENTPISFNQPHAPELSSLGDTPHTTGCSLLHHTVIESSSSAASALTHGAHGATSSAAGLVDAGVAAGCVMGDSLQQSGIQTCADHSLCALQAVDAAHVAEASGHASNAVHSVVAAVADVCSAAGHLIA